MSATVPTPTSYDEFPYPNYSFPQTHPDRLAVVARLLGLNPVPPERCRILELGCAGGGNLIPMADSLPESTLLGIDLSSRQVAEGQKGIAELGLKNVELRAQSILDFDPGAETYDYILCHGVYSWVPPEVQDHILDICARHLSPSGIAFVSYNTLPGWHMRGMIRDMMLFHGNRFSDPRQKVAQARGLLDFVVNSTKDVQTPYSQFLRSEMEMLRRFHDSYLYHEHLEEHNAPVYFHQFAGRAAAHGLRYLADVELSTLALHSLPPEVGQTLQRVANDLIQLEQYLDFLRNRMFRQTMLVRTGIEPKYHIEASLVTNFFVGTSLRPAASQPDLRSFNPEQFRAPSGAAATSNQPIVKAAMVVMAEEWPQELPFHNLRTRARAKLTPRGVQDAAIVREDEMQLGQAMLQFYTSGIGIVEFRTRPLRLTTRPSPRPLARPVARWQARSSLLVTNIRHEQITLTEFGRQTLLRLDGEHTRSEIVREMAGLVQGGQLNVQQNGETIRDPRRVEQILHSTVEQQINQFIQQALLLA
jgi:methyltransferase-like protein/cyclopropane fatty-acyl-phospholipid synthase-like methyltransferase